MFGYGGKDVSLVSLETRAEQRCLPGRCNDSTDGREGGKRRERESEGARESEAGGGRTTPKYLGREDGEGNVYRWRGKQERD